MENKGTDFLKSNAYVSANELVDGMLIREGDTDQKNKGIYLFLLKEVYQDLNLSVIRNTERYLLKVNKQMQCVNVPDGFLELSSISVPNRHGKFEPLIVNENIDTDIVDIGASSICGCDECQCDCAYCSSIRNYELISSIVPAFMPDGSTQNFTSTIRKKILKDGTYVRETTVPTQIFVDNVHTDTILQTTTETLCNLEIKECGCVVNTPKNEQLIYEFCDCNSIEQDCGAPVRMRTPDLKYYKMNDRGDRIHFPGDFPYDTVLVRFYADRKTKDLRIPYMAQNAMRMGIKKEYSLFNGGKEYQTFELLYNKAKMDLADNLTRLKLSDFYKHVLGTFNVK